MKKVRVIELESVHKSFTFYKQLTSKRLQQGHF